MKKSSLYLILSIMIIAAGCRIEEFENPEAGHGISEIYAAVEAVSDDHTKTYLEGTEILWSEGDQIAAFIGNTSLCRYNIDPSSAGSRNAVFKKDETYTGSSYSTDIQGNVAWYPFCELYMYGKTYFSFSNFDVSATQTYSPSSFGSGAFLMVAVTKDSDDHNFYFKNLFGALMIQLKGAGSIRSVSVKGNSDEVLAGYANATASYGRDPEIILAAGNTAIYTVTLDCGNNGVELKPDESTPFIIALPPVAFEKGFTITVEDTWGGTKEYSTSKTNPIYRSKIRRMPVLEYIGKEPQAKEPEEGDYIDEYGYNHGQGIEIDGVVWAPVNCGYHGRDYRKGKLYQWGRKYGQGHSLSDATNAVIEDVAVSLIQGNEERYADIFYKGSRNYYDWLSPRDGRVWNSGSEADPVKTEYDPCPSGWRVPTYAELYGLQGNRSDWTTDDVGHNGYWFSGTTTYSSDIPQVFLPACGIVSYTGDLRYSDKFGEYWSSRPSSPSTVAYCFEFRESGREDEGEITEKMDWTAGRCEGCAVRCVKDDSELVPVESITLGKTSQSLYVGDSETITFNISPSGANAQFVHWSSADPDIATVGVEDGKVTAVALGTVVITATAGMQTAICEVTVLPEPGPATGDYIDEYGVNHGQGIEIDGVVWAPVNCGYHAKDFKYGKLYQWGRRYGQGYDGNLNDIEGWNIGTYSDSSVPKYKSATVSLNTGQSEDNAGYFFKVTSPYTFDWLNSSDDGLWNRGTEEKPEKATYDPCPDGWRVPTYAELENLSANRSSWITNNSQIGCWFSGSQTYSSSVPRVFFPAAGYRSRQGTALQRGSDGIYWSSRSNNDGLAYELQFSSSYANMYDMYRADGFSVRCVRVTD